MKSFIIPKAAANNYLFRLPPSTSPEDTDTETFNYRLLWPAILTIDSLDNPVVNTCPQNMHMLVWGASRPLRVRVYDQSAAHTFHPTLGNNKNNNNNNIDNKNNRNLKDSEAHLPLHVTSYEGSGFPKISAFLNIINGIKNVKENIKKNPNFAEAELSTSSEYLFIPNNHLVSIYPAEISEKKIDSLKARVLGSVEERTGHLFVSCFVDASNLNKFKDALDLSSTVSPFDQLILDTFHSNSIDVKMDRTAGDSLLSSLLNGEQNRKRTIDTNANADTTPQQATESSTVKKNSNKRSRGTASGGSSSSFRDWQESNKWNLLITSLTLPRAPVPHIVSIGRNNVTLDWSSPYIPEPADTTKFGFNITICKRKSYGGRSSGSGINDYGGDAQRTLFGGDREGEGESRREGKEGVITIEGEKTVDLEDCFVWELERGKPLLLEYFNKQQSLLVGGEVSLFSSTLPELLPDTPYTFKMTIFYDASESMSSEWSSLFRTHPITVPSEIPQGVVAVVTPAVTLKKKGKGKKSKQVEVSTPVSSEGSIGGLRGVLGHTPNSIILQFSTPFDDGGSAILGYHVWCRYADHTLFHQSWRWVGAYLSTPPPTNQLGYTREVLIPNLLAKTSYAFKLSAYNIIGSASLSYSSPAVTTSLSLPPSQLVGNIVNSLFLYGRGHPSFATGGVQEGEKTGGLLPPSMLVTLDDVAQTLSIRVQTQPLSDNKASDTSDSLVLQSDKINESNSTAPRTAKVPESQYTMVTIDGWVSHYSPLMFSVTSECVWVLPNTVNSGEREVANADDLHGRIAVVLRGNIDPCFFFC